MKVFWSWQADTPGKTGRHFVRRALVEAIEALKVHEDIEEPTERAALESLHLDHDRQGLSGSPDLAPAIFDKIDASAVFVADVTLVGEVYENLTAGQSRKKVINSNVAIEYGYALRGLTSAKVLLVQNTFYGDRESLPFDLKHKAGPIQFNLSPEAEKSEQETILARLRGDLVVALRPYIDAMRKHAHKAFEETPSTSTPAFYFQATDVLAEVGEPGLDQISYQFAEPRAFYLRLIPTTALDKPLRNTELLRLADQRKLGLLTRTAVGGISGRNRYGAVVYDPHGSSPVPVGLTQVFSNGELWAISREFQASYRGHDVIPTGNVKNIYGRVLRNFLLVATNDLRLQLPFNVEMGAIGLQGMYLGIDQRQVYGPILQDVLRIRKVINNGAESAIDAVVTAFLEELFDLAGVRLNT